MFCFRVNRYVISPWFCWQYLNSVLGFVEKLCSSEVAQNWVNRIIHHIMRYDGRKIRSLKHHKILLLLKITNVKKVKTCSVLERIGWANLKTCSQGQLSIWWERGGIYREKKKVVKYVTSGLTGPLRGNPRHKFCTRKTVVLYALWKWLVLQLCALNEKCSICSSNLQTAWYTLS